MAGHNATDAEMIEALTMLKKHGTQQAAATALGISRSTFQSRVQVARQHEARLTGPKVDPLVSAQAKVKELTRAMSGMHAHNESAARVRGEIYNLAALTPEPPYWIDQPRKDTKSKHGAIPFAFWSDWHYGEVIDKAETGGVNEFNRDIAKDRIHRLVERTIVLARGFAFRDDAPAPPGIIVALGGDMLSGDIHEELAETNEAPPFVCVADLIDILIGAIDRMKVEFGKVFVPCVIGNHGRTTKKIRAKEAVYRSYEWNLYCMLERHYAKDRNVNIYVPGETDALFRVAGQRFLLTHGNALGVKGGDGIIGALGPIARGAIKIRSSEFKIGREFDYLIMGHWHQEIWLPRVIVNNALKGYDEYARLFLRADPSRPSQCLWFVHPEYGITARISVYVDEELVKAKDRKWVEVLQ